MAPCIEVNLTDVDLYYVNKIQSENKNWAWWLNNLGTLVVFIIGFFGNILCLLVLCRRLISALDELHQFEYKLTLIAHTNASCKLYNYIRYIFYSMSSWIVVALAIERVIAIKFPLWSKTICTVVNARRIILIILLFTMFIQSYHLIIKGLDCSPSVSSTRVCRCKTIRHHTYLKLDIIFTVYVWRLFLMTLLPSAMIITANILIMNKLFHEGSLLDHTNVIDNAQHKMKVLYKISRMLVIVTSIYLLLHVPGSSLDIIKYMYISVFKMCNVKWKYYIYMSHEIFDLLTNFNYGINFYLYIISGKHIRNELVRAVKHSPLRSKSSVENYNYRRSSCFMSSSVLSSRNHQARYSNVPLSEWRNGSCQQRLPLCDEHQ
ncbi:unnamed protein product [Rotaria socialis]|uniref:G-protein coupled receptors family 1 profile domain-containing protein n=1 Tax=Rotaria socialis TaxID=392032 RepID=A0A820K5T0_9BILA|nr:unnamed protein product [Rotaria socialis]CAF4376900.1 unnamed protein product [Rotaria socialis]CAF4451778.1 unnamed protein product [Rotaria socialis]CAF4644240.1 unnamed protein product [Rotaria socialis]CAF4728236.1 unnamed protein product [Rotaria socialis]